MHRSDCPSRRVFLRVFAASGVAAAVDVGCGPAGVSPLSFGTVSAGNVSALPVGSLHAVPGQPVAIGRDTGGVYAMTLTCTHGGCDMGSQGSVSSAGLFCGCHGSQFDGNGNVTRGPANAPLAHFAVSIDAAGEVTVDGAQEVAASTRAPA
ncbi:MAG: Rieske (2Fe-2S) protein [Polyangiales bacterium]